MKKVSVFKVIDSMKVQELKVLLNSKIPEFRLYKDYIKNKIDEKIIIQRYF